LLLFAGAVGKSAQVPAARVVAGRHGRSDPGVSVDPRGDHGGGGRVFAGSVPFLFALSPLAQTLVAWTGGITALGAALSALTATDIKKVLAYSTISQLGFMVMAMGVGDPQLGCFI
jgi:NADH:ubiquinone oxidoreductase subunit 5 (subunit L)/multisubunit Na+/H+ antiporter MnhA subunit